jgi:hypothetical protein
VHQPDFFAIQYTWVGVNDFKFETPGAFNVNPERQFFFNKVFGQGESSPGLLLRQT